METVDPPPANLLASYCARHGATPETFSETVLWQCLYPHSVSLARWIWRVYPDYFRSDLELIRLVFQQRDLEEIKSEINIHRRFHPAGGWLRRRLRVRMSGQRLLNLAQQSLASN